MKIFEGIKNIIDTQPNSQERKEDYVDELWDMLQKSYEPIGGIHGSGFMTKEDMIKNIPFWKLFVKDGEIKAAMLYRDKNGRKRVAITTDGSMTGKKALANMFDRELKRAYSEVSGPSLRFIIKTLGIDFVLDMARPIESVEKILKEPVEPVDVFDTEYPEKLKPFLYRRNLSSGKQAIKVLIGTPYKKIS